MKPRTPRRLRSRLRWTSPLRAEVGFPLYVAAIVAGLLIGRATGNTQRGFDIGLIAGLVGPGAIAAWLDHRGRLPDWARRQTIPAVVPRPGMGIYSAPPPEDELGPIYVGRADQAPVQVWLQRRRARTRQRRAGHG